MGWRLGWWTCQWVPRAMATPPPATAGATKVPTASAESPCDLSNPDPPADCPELPLPPTPAPTKPFVPTCMGWQATRVAPTGGTVAGTSQRT